MSDFLKDSSQIKRAAREWVALICGTRTHSQWMQKRLVTRLCKGVCAHASTKHIQGVKIEKNSGVLEGERSPLMESWDFRPSTKFHKFVQI